MVLQFVTLINVLIYKILVVGKINIRLLIWKHYKISKDCLATIILIMMYNSAYYKNYYRIINFNTYTYLHTMMQT